MDNITGKAPEMHISTFLINSCFKIFSGNYDIRLCALWLLQNTYDLMKLDFHSVTLEKEMKVFQMKKLGEEPVEPSFKSTKVFQLVLIKHIFCMTIFYIHNPTQYLNLTTTLLIINTQQISSLLRQKS